MTFLSCAGNNVGVEGAKAIAEALKTNQTIWHLNLLGEKRNTMKTGKNGIVFTHKNKQQTGNKIGTEGVKALSGMLSVNSRIDYLYLGSEDK